MNNLDQVSEAIGSLRAETQGNRRTLDSNHEELKILISNGFNSVGKTLDKHDKRITENTEHRKLITGLAAIIGSIGGAITAFIVGVIQKNS